MTDRELKRLGRAELIDITYEQQKRLEECEETIRELQEKLEEKEIRISKAGSIAEAALRINGVFEAAQSAADQYLVSVRAAGANAEAIVSEAKKQRDAILLAAKKQAAEILRKAQTSANEMTAAAEKESQEKWAGFEQKANELIAAHEELQALIGIGSKT